MKIQLPYTFSPRIGGLCAAAVLAGVGMFFTWGSASLEIGSLTEPGPGFIPLGLGLLLAGFSAAIIGDTLRAPRVVEPLELGHRDVLVVYGLLVAAAFCFERVGAYLTLGAFGAAVLIFVGRLAAWRAVLSAAVGVGVVWLFFDRLLGLRLPPAF